MIRLFDITLSFIGLVILSPFFILISILIVSDSRGGIFFRQTRIGLDGKPFKLWKFRTMKPASEGAGQLTIGTNDQRITKIGKALRARKLDELPQLFNVLAGEMSLVGPRPEVPKYVNLYTEEQKKVLSVKPGVTDKASLQYFDENEILAKSEHPEQTYIDVVMPEKIRLNMDYVNNPSLGNYFQTIFQTIGRVAKS